MGPRFVNIDRDTPLLLPPNLRDWLPADHLVHFIGDAVDQLDLRAAKVNGRGTGSEQYPPSLRLSWLFYSDATGCLSSRQIERASFENVAGRGICADTHPDHDTIGTLRRANKELLGECFVKVLQLAQELKLLRVGQLTTVVDGTKARAAAEWLEYQKKLEERAAQKERGERVRGPEPPPPNEPPRPSDQYHFTDPDSRIMKAGSGQHCEQAYNAPAAVEVESRLIVAAPVSAAPNDQQQLEPRVAAIAPEVGGVKEVLVDSGFYSETAVGALEQTATGELTGVVVDAAMEKTGHHRSVEDWEAKVDPPAPRPGASVAEVMRHRLATAAGRAQYKLRQQTVEPVFGIIKEALGFRRFRLRGLAQVNWEWKLVCTAYNLKRLFLMGAGAKLAPRG